MPLGTALRTAFTDFYFNSWRLAPANLVWGLVLILALLAGPTTLLGAVLLVVLPVPAVGVYRMAAVIARGAPASFADFLGGMRRSGPAAIGTGLGSVLLAVVFATNVVSGFEAGNPIGWFLSGMALWGLVGLAMLLVALFPLLVDPAREALGLRQRLALAGLAVIGRPGRMLALSAMVALVLAVSTVMFALLVMVSLAYVALVSSRYVLPLVDALEARLQEARRSR